MTKSNTQLMNDLLKMSSQVVELSEDLSKEIQEFEKTISKLHLPFEVVVQIAPGEHVKWLQSSRELGYYFDVNKIKPATLCDSIVMRKIIQSFNDILEHISTKYKQHLKEGKQHEQTSSTSTSTNTKENVRHTAQEQGNSPGVDAKIQGTVKPGRTKKSKRRKAVKNSNVRNKQDTKTT